MWSDPGDTSVESDENSRLQLVASYSVFHWQELWPGEGYTVNHRIVRHHSTFDQFRKDSLISIDVSDYRLQGPGKYQG